MRRHITFIILNFCFFLNLNAQPSIIEWSQTTPDSHLLSLHYKYWESYLPFDGLVIYVNHEDYKGIYGERQLYAAAEDQWALHSLIFSGKKLNFDNYKHAIDDLSNTPFQKFTNNFILISWYAGNSMGKAFDWSNEALWATTLHNIKIVAKIAKASGVKGIWFDTEQYAGWGFTNYNKIKAVYPNTPVFSEYQKLIRKRGMEIMNAINEEFPKGELVLSFATTLTYSDVVFGKFNTTAENVNASPRSLLPSLVDGLIFSATNNKSAVTDGNELSYYFKTEAQFKFSRDFIKKDAAVLSSIPQEYSKNIQVAFGLYPTSDSSSSARHFTAKELEEAFYFALKYTDRYVWTWGELQSFWVKPGEAVLVPLRAHPTHKDAISPSAQNALRINAQGIRSEFLEAIINAKARYLRDH